MSKITAKGKRNNVYEDVKCFMENGSIIIEVNGEFDEDVQSQFDQLLKNAPTIGGTYHPPANSMLAALAVLESAFFDSLPEMQIEGDIGTIPGKPGVVY